MQIAHFLKRMRKYRSVTVSFNFESLKHTSQWRWKCVALALRGLISQFAHESVEEASVSNDTLWEDQSLSSSGNR